MSRGNDLTRRSFVKGLAVAGAATAAAGMLAGCKKNEMVSLVPDKWDEEVDVVVVGFGGAGAAAAIEAHDAGAEVLVLEKGVTRTRPRICSSITRLSATAIKRF